jgi:hypothetical protein
MVGRGEREERGRERREEREERRGERERYMCEKESMKNDKVNRNLSYNDITQFEVSGDEVEGIWIVEISKSESRGFSIEVDSRWASIHGQQVIHDLSFPLSFPLSLLC